MLCRNLVGNPIDKKVDQEKNHTMVVFYNGSGRCIRRMARKVALKRSRNDIETIIHAASTEIREGNVIEIMAERRRQVGIVKNKCFGRLRR